MFNSYDMSNFGSYVRDLRKSLNLTQKDVESLVKVSCETLRKIESGLVVPRYETLEYLTIAYKTDLLKAFSLHRSSHELFNFYAMLDDIIVENNNIKLGNLIDELNSIVSADSTSNLVNYIEYDQLRLLVSGIKSFFCDKEDLSLSKFIEAMKLSVLNFDIEKVEENCYSQLEKRILILISLSLSKKKYYKKANKLLHKCLSEAVRDENHDIKDKFTIIKIYFNLSYNYHCLDDNQKTLMYVSEGINYCRKNHISFLLPGLLYRRGICKLNIGDETYNDDILYSITLLKILGKNDLAKKYQEIAEDMYSITIN